MKPTKDDYNRLADILGDALDHCNEAGLYGDELFTAHKALRLAANMPSEEEIIDIIWDNLFDEVDRMPPSITLKIVAHAIYKRLGVEK